MTHDRSPDVERVRKLIEEHVYAICDDERAHVSVEGSGDAALAILATLPSVERIRAEALEEAARYIEGHGGVIPGASVFAPLVSGNNQPCMSGDPRDRLPSHRRCQFDDATSSLAKAIRLPDQGWSEIENAVQHIRSILLKYRGGEG